MALRIRHDQSWQVWAQRALLVLLIGLLAVTGWYTYRWYMHGEALPVDVPAFAIANSRIDEEEVTEREIDAHQVLVDQPRYLSVAGLGIEKARIFGLGVNDNGALADPSNIHDIAWYNKSATPGSGGVLLMNGHNGGFFKDGIFAKLHTLSNGSIIEVERGDAEVFRYEVREVRKMHLDEVNETGMKMMAESAEPGVEALNIITCDGTWVPRLNQFDHRIMLRAVLVSDDA